LYPEFIELSLKALFDNPSHMTILKNAALTTGFAPFESGVSAQRQ
jgi:hypothetical protein